jgi:hypothetical protein
VGQLAAAGYTFPFDISGLVKDAIKNGGADPFSYFYAKLIQSKQFNHYYPGIKRSDGTLRMTPAQYQQYTDAALSLAKKNGFAVSRAQIGNEIANDVSLDEYSFRVQAASQIRSNKDLFNAMNAMGIPIKNAQDAFNFMTGKSPKHVYDTYEAATFIAGATSAGLSIDAKRAKELAAQTPDLTDFAAIQKGYADLADKLKTAGQNLSAFGLTQRDLEVLEFGGAGQAAIAAKANQALLQNQAQSQTEITGQDVTLKGGRPTTQNPAEATA